MADPFLSELKYRGSPSQDFIEVAVDAGMDVSELVVTVYRSNGTIRSTVPLADLSFTTSEGKDVYVIDRDSTDAFDRLRQSDAVSLSDTDTVFSFVSFDDTPNPVTASEGPAAGLTSTEIGSAGRGASLQTTDGGASYEVETSPNPGTIPCLAAGTRIETMHGMMRVEDLTPGVEIAMLDGSCRPLLHVMSRKIVRSEFEANPKLSPVRIRKGALGNGLPIRDLLVSRQHRMLVSSPIVTRMFDVPQVLVAAIRLTGLPGIDVDESAREITYYHLVFEAHEVIFAEGAPTESILLGTEAFKLLPDAAVTEMRTLFPDLVRSLPQVSAHVIPDRHRQSRLVLRHGANNRALLASFGGRRDPQALAP